MRYFISVDVSDEGVKDEIVKFGETISGLGDVNLVARENLHMTLLFLGERDEEDERELKDRFTNHASSLDVDEFTCTISGVGVFPHMNFVRVVWAGAEPSSTFSELHMKFSEGFDGENDHDFVPHITVARVNDVSGAAKRELQAAIRERSEGFGRFQVSDVRLTRSELTPDGPNYTDIAVEEL